MKSTAVVYFENQIYKRVKDDCDFKFDEEYYHSPEFLARPNSTLRLSLVNYKALRVLAKTCPIQLFHYDEIKSRVDSLMGYDRVVVNTIAAKRTIEFLEELFAETENVVRPPEIILGTEYSWTNNIATGNVSQAMVDSVYTDHTLLRHTARTDRHLYEPNSTQNARVQEFEIGLDIDAMPKPLPSSERSGVLFVAAPEGRTTKNNDEIELIIEEIESRNLDSAIPIHVIRPPYSTAEYWELLASSKYLIFTSVGETFSYVLNDALAMGTVALRRPELFATRTARFGVDAYWDTGLRYTSVENAVETLLGLESDPARYQYQSELAQRIARKHFSLETVTENWYSLLADVSLNTRSILIMDVSRLAGGVNEALAIARSVDCNIVMAYMNRGEDLNSLTSYSCVSSDRSQAVVPYCYFEAGGRLRHLGPDMKPGRFDEQPSESTVGDYLRLVFRTNKARKAYLDSSISDEFLEGALGGISYMEGNRLVPIWVEKIDLPV